MGRGFAASHGPSLSNMYNIRVPTSIQTSGGKKGKFYLNLNKYRNAHFFQLNKAKQMFFEQVAPLLKDLPKMKKIRLRYTIYTGSNTDFDLNNVASIVDKFFCDTLKESGVIEDDNKDIVLSVTTVFGGIIKGDPHAMVRIRPIGAIEKREPMQITLTQPEIETAIINFVKSQMTIAEGQRIEIDLRATRGEEGYTALIDIVRDEVSAPAAPVAQPVPVATRAAPTPEVDTADEAVETSKSILDSIEEDSNNGADDVAPSRPASSLFGNLRSDN